MSEERIGKIESVSFGMGGYDGAMIGISFTLSSGAWGVGDFWGAWAIERSDYCKWTEEDRIKQLGETTMRIAQLLNDAKVETVEQLKGRPVMVTFEKMKLKSWRILTEAL